MYSDMSMRTIARSSSNRNSASARASSVLPTPVGPRNRNEPIGRCGSESPARERRIAFATARTGSSWPIDALVQVLLEPHELRHLAFHEPRHRDAGPLGDDLGDVFLVDLFLQHRTVVLHVVEPRAELGRPRARAPGCARSAAARRARGRRRARRARRRASRRSSRSLPSWIAVIASFSDCQCATIPSRSSCSDCSSASSVSSRCFDASSVSFCERGPLDLELADAPLDDVDLERHRVDLDAQPRRGLVDEVDRLVGELPAGDVAIREHRGRDERGVLDADAVVHLVALLQPAQDRDRVLDRRLRRRTPAGSDARARRPSRCTCGTRRASSRRSRRSSPRASIGLIMLPASTAPSAPPAPTSVCSSSMNVMISPSESAISLSTALNRSSNSPRYFAPATIEPMSSATTRLLRRPSGTSPSTMRRASPSTIAVLPTPGSPMSTGLFFVRRDSTWMMRRISSSRPMTGSILPCARGLGEVAAVLLERLVLLLGVVARDAVRAAHLLERVEHRVVRDADAAQQVADAAGHVRSSRAGRARSRGTRRRAARAPCRPLRAGGTPRSRAARRARSRR